MATAVARVKRIRIAPRKVRLVADLIRGKKVSDARDILYFTSKGCAPIVGKALDVKYNMSRASETFLPRIRSATSLTFLGAIRIRFTRATAVAIILNSYFFLRGWDLNVRVGENSPSL
jgi:ribosomal protein L22